MVSSFNHNFCILLSNIPTQEQVNTWQNVKVYRSPHGCNEVPTMNLNEAHLLQTGWIKIQIGKHPDHQYNLGNNGLTGQREQYGLKHCIAMTVHAIMGKTVPALVTKVGQSSDDSL